LSTVDSTQLLSESDENTETVHKDFVAEEKSDSQFAAVQESVWSAHS
jgi:hypothetical protein